MAKKRRRRRWNKAGIRTVQTLYPDISTIKLARRLGRKVHHVYALAVRLGLRKSAKYLASADACRLRRGDNVGAAYRFRPGHVPANKGLRRPGWAPGRMKETQFKRGQPNHNIMPLGSERTIDGYLYRKVAEVMYVPYTVNWKPVHILLWESRHGPVPAGHVVAFRDGDKANIRLSNLVLMTRADNLRRVSFHNYPKPIALAIQLRGALQRQINKRERIREKQD
jgi:HNH endonuclease